MGSTSTPPSPSAIEWENIYTRYTEGKKNKREVREVYILAQLADGERGGL
jgi:hypothetical protein